jgi:hypothetical protein
MSKALQWLFVLIFLHSYSTSSSDIYFPIVSRGDAIIRDTDLHFDVARCYAYHKHNTICFLPV